jgi:rod shape-determining protein MreC
VLKKNESKKRHGIITVSIFLLLSFLFLTVNIKFGYAPTFVESIVITIISPFQELVSKSLNNVSRVWKNYIFLIESHEENTILKKDNERLNFFNNILKERLNKFQRLERFSDFITQDRESKLLPADIVGFDSTGWSKVFIINRGFKNGIRKDMAVVTYNGLVGRIVQSTSKYSKVLLITDPRSAVDAIIQRTRDRGIVVGAHNGICEMKYLSINSDVKEGDMVISSGLGGVFQKGLSIGKISKVYEKKIGLFRQVEIIPTAELTTIEELLVVVSPFEIPEVKE